MGLPELKQIYDDKESKIVAETRHAQDLNSQKVVSDTILAATTSLIRYLEGYVSQAEIVNQLESINTPDSLAVIPHIESLNETMKGLKNTDLSEITGVMTSILTEVKSIPKENIEIPEQEVVDYSDQFKSLKDAVVAVEKVIKAQNLVVEAPVINLPAPNVNVDAPDLKPLQSGLKDVVGAVKKIVIPEYKTDNKAVEKLITLSNKLLKELLDKPVSKGGGGSGRVSPYQDSAGVPAFVTLNAQGEIPVSLGSDEVNVNIDMVTDGIATEATLAKTLEKPHNTYTWTDGLLTEKVSVYLDRTETTTYTWSNGLLIDKITIIT